MAKLGDMIGYTPFEDKGITAEDFVGIQSLVGKDIVIHAAEAFVSQTAEGADNPGVYVLFSDIETTETHYTTTHAKGIIGRLLDNEKVRECLEREEPIECKVVKRASRTNKGMTVITIE